MLEDEVFDMGCYSRAAVNLDVGALTETGRTTFEILRILVGCRS